MSTANGDEFRRNGSLNVWHLTAFTGALQAFMGKGNRRRQLYKIPAYANIARNRNGKSGPLRSIIGQFSMT